MKNSFLSWFIALIKKDMKEFEVEKEQKEKNWLAIRANEREEKQ